LWVRRRGSSTAKINSTEPQPRDESPYSAPTEPKKNMSKKAKQTIGLEKMVGGAGRRQLFKAAAKAGGGEADELERSSQGKSGEERLEGSKKLWGECQTKWTAQRKKVRKKGSLRPGD